MIGAACRNVASNSASIPGRTSRTATSRIGKTSGVFAPAGAGASGMVNRQFVTVEGSRSRRLGVRPEAGPRERNAWRGTGHAEYPNGTIRNNRLDAKLRREQRSNRARGCAHRPAEGYRANQTGGTDMNAKLPLSIIAAALFSLPAYAHDCSG